MLEATPRRVGLSCLAAVLMLGVLAALLLPGLVALASPVPPVPQPNPIAVRITPATGALGGGVLAAGSERYHPIVVHNDGVGSFRYDLSVLTDGPLADIIRLEIRAWTGPCTAATFANAVPVTPQEVLSAISHRGLRLVPAGAQDQLCARLSMPADLAPHLHGGVTDAILRVTATEN